MQEFDFIFEDYDARLKTLRCQTDKGAVISVTDHIGAPYHADAALREAILGKAELLATIDRGKDCYPGGTK